MPESSREPNGPLGVEPAREDQADKRRDHNTRNELGRSWEGVDGTGFVSQGFGPELASLRHPKQPKPR